MNTIGKVGIVGLGALALAGGIAFSSDTSGTPSVPIQQKPSPTQVESKQKEDTEMRTVESNSTAPSKKEEAPRTSCHPSYSGCLKKNAGDYDCAGGSGNGPNYTGPVRVTGPDVFDLDRDNDGMACE